jgi:hypothetical protein
MFTYRLTFFISSSVAPRLAVFAIANLAALEMTLSVTPDDQDGPEKKRRANTEQRETTTRVHIIIKPDPLVVVARPYYGGSKGPLSVLSISP